MRGYSLDPNPRISLVKEVFALVRIPRIKRERVPATNVEVVAELQIALDRADAANHLYAAKVLGPSRSSEGFELYYILEMY